MSPCATRSSSDGPGPRRGGQAGSSLIVTIGLVTVLLLIVLVSLSWARSGTSQAAREGRGDIAIQVADAGVNRYISRLVEDPRYWDHFVDQAEDPRVDPSGRVHPPGSPWIPGVPWTYEGGPTTWVPMQDARFGRASYSLQISPPPPGSDLVTVQSTAQVSQNTPRPLTRTVQSQIHPTSIADFQMISNATIKYGTTATTTGKLYSAEDINHQGVARAPVYAQRLACSDAGFNCTSSHTPTSVYTLGAYDSRTTPSFREKFPTPIDFNHFTRTRLDIKDAAQHGGLFFDQPDASGWLAQFLADGRVRVHKLTQTNDLGVSLGRIGCPAVYDVPANGAMYFEQSVIVSDGGSRADECGATAGPRPSVVNGRVTIATKGNVYVGGNITYHTGGDDVLGLISANELIIAEYAPRDLTWRAATLAQSGQWRTNRPSPLTTNPHRSMVYIGSQTTANGGYATMFPQREYHYDETLQRLRPPFYPILEGSWETYYWREVTPPGGAS